MSISIMTPNGELNVPTKPGGGKSRTAKQNQRT